MIKEIKVVLDYKGSEIQCSFRDDELYVDASSLQQAFVNLHPNSTRFGGGDGNGKVKDSSKIISWMNNITTGRYKSELIKSQLVDDSIDNYHIIMGRYTTGAQFRKRVYLHWALALKYAYFVDPKMKEWLETELIKLDSTIVDFIGNNIKHLESVKPKFDIIDNLILDNLNKSESSSSESTNISTSPYREKVEKKKTVEIMEESKKVNNNLLKLYSTSSLCREVCGSKFTSGKFLDILVSTGIIRYTGGINKTGFALKSPYKDLKLLEEVKQKDGSTKKMWTEYAKYVIEAKLKSTGTI